MKLIKSDNNILYYFRDPRYEGKGYDSYLVWTLVPIAVYDYVDPDYSDTQGWLQEIPYTGEIEYEEIVQYVCHESLEQALADFGYEFTDVNTVYILNYNYEKERDRKSTPEQAVDNALDLW